MTAEQQGRRRRLADRIARNEPGAVLYGAVVTAGVLAAVSANVSHVHWVAPSVVVVLAGYWLAHVYVATQEQLYQGDRRALPRRTAQAAVEELPVLAGGVPAIVVYIGTYWGLGLTNTGAALTALWFSVGFLAVIGYLGAHRAGLTGWRLAVESVGAASLGLITVIAKLLLH